MRAPKHQYWPQPLLPVLLAGSALRTAIVWLAMAQHPSAWFFAQASELAVLANSLVTGHGLASPFGVSSGPSAFLAPGYPAIVAVSFRIFGSYTSHAEVALMLLQLFFATAAGALMVLIALRLFNKRSAVIAGVLWALSPTLLFFPTIFWESSLSFLLLTAMLATAIHCAEQPQHFSWTTLFALIVAVFYINPSLLPTVFGIAVWVAFRTHVQPRRAVVAGALLSIALMSLWPIRNERALHAFIPTRSNLGYEFWQGNRPGANGFFDPTLHPNNNLAERERLAQLGEVDYMREKGAYAVSAIEANPPRFLALSVKRFACFWAGIEPRGSGIIVGFTMLSTIFGLLGLFRLYKRNASLASLFAIPIVLFPLPYYITHPDFRFRAVLDSVMFLLTAFAFSGISSRQSSLSAGR